MAGTDKTGKEPPPKTDKRGSERILKENKTKQKPPEPPKETSNPGPRGR
jgi:hypothetical protein